MTRAQFNDYVYNLLCRDPCPPKQNDDCASCTAEPLWRAVAEAAEWKSRALRAEEAMRQAAATLEEYDDDLPAYSILLAAIEHSENTEEAEK